MLIQKFNCINKKGYYEVYLLGERKYKYKFIKYQTQVKYYSIMYLSKAKRVQRNEQH